MAKVRYARNYSAAYKGPTRHGVTLFLGGFDRKEWIFIFAVQLTPWLVPMSIAFLTYQSPFVGTAWTYHHWLVILIMIPLPFYFLWKMRLIYKDGRDLFVWFTHVRKFYFHWKHPLSKRVVINHREIFMPGNVKSENIVTIPNTTGGLTWHENEKAA